jgi:nucleotide-binding universal stress UspA family protein
MEPADRTLGRMLDEHARPRTDDPLAAMRRRVTRDLLAGMDEAIEVSVRIESGEPVACIIEAAEQEKCSLIVTGVARDELFGRIFVGNTANQLVRRSRVPVLVVRDRASRPYSRIVVATDFSHASRHALVTALGLFPDTRPVLLHGHDVPSGGLAGATGQTDFMEMEGDRRAEFLEDVPIDKAVLDAIPLLIARGTAEQVIVDYAEGHEVDLTVIGSHGHGAMFDALIGSTTKRILERSAGDLLIVIDPATKR